MKNPILKLFLFVSIVTMMFPAYADKVAVKKIIAKQFGTEISKIKVVDSAAKGLYRVEMPPKIYYVTTDGKHLISGDVITVSTGENLTNPLKDKIRAEAIKSLGEDSMIVFGKDSMKHTVTVFTDIDCGYCRKLHNEIKAYNDKGIRVRYLAYPRAGIGSPSYNTAVSVWCSDDRRAAMTKAKKGMTVAAKDCANPVRSHYKMGEKMGIRGTPAIVLESGQVVPGYVPAARLSAGLNAIAKK